MYKFIFNTNFKSGVLIGLIGWMGLLLSLTGCSTKQLLTTNDYQPVRQALYSSQTKPNEAKTISKMDLESIYAANEQFPKYKEKKGFITTLEQAYLNIWLIDQNLDLVVLPTDTKQSESNQNLKLNQNFYFDKNNIIKSNLDKLRQQTKTFDERKYTSITREANTFFFQETEEGYIPSEPEIIIHHFLTSMYYIKNNNWDSARVELKKSNDYFKAYEDVPLRFWSASLWVSLGEWEEAKVDLRRIQDLDPAYKMKLEKYVSLSNPPEQWDVIFNGFGPEIKFIDENFDPVFEFAANDKQNNSKNWYERHLKRNTDFRDIVKRSNYMANYLGIKSQSAATKSVGVVGAGTIATVGVVVGIIVIGGGIYIAAITKNTDALGILILAGLTVAETGLTYSKDFYNRWRNEAENDQKKQLDQSRNYRYVRFLPSNIDLLDTNKNDTSDSILPETNAKWIQNSLAFLLPSKDSKTKIRFLLSHPIEKH